MKAKATRTYLIIGAVTVLSAIGIYAWVRRSKRIKQEKAALKAKLAELEEAAKRKEKETPASSSTSTTPSAADIALAIDYRTWANSTEALKKKYGKTSPFDLDSTSSKPYNKNFLNSYAAGKTEYEASKKPASAASGATTLSPELKKQFLDLLNWQNRNAVLRTDLLDSQNNQYRSVSWLFTVDINTSLLAKGQDSRQIFRIELYDGYPSAKRWDRATWRLYESDEQGARVKVVASGFWNYTGSQFTMSLAWALSSWGDGVPARNIGMVSKTVPASMTDTIYNLFKGYFVSKPNYWKDWA